MSGTLRSLGCLLGLTIRVAASPRDDSAVNASHRHVGAYEELFYPQSLDHFNPEDHSRWPHRYLLSNRSWDGRGRLENGCRGPILLYAGNEGDIEGFWDGNGFMIEELAPEWGGLLIFPEQRFYGKSLPKGSESWTPEQLRFLTTSQVIEDYIELIHYLKATLSEAEQCPVVAFGGSYGGTLAALLRASHPASITGALAASSELGYYDVARWSEHGVTTFSFEDVCVQDYQRAHPECLPAIQATVQALEGATRADVARSLHVCEERSLGKGNSDLFVYALESLPQADYPYVIGGMPAKPVTAVCSILVVAARRGGAQSLITAAAKVVAMALVPEGTSCVPYQGPGGPGNTPGDGPGPSAWGWQSCTETLHAFSAHTLRKYAFNYSASLAECAQLYGSQVAPDTGALARRFGGFALADGTAGVSRLIWSHGTLDPWHGWFRNISAPPPGSEVYHFLMEDSAHHLDLRSSHPDEDPPAVTAARKREKEIIRSWILTASQGQLKLLV